MHELHHYGVEVLQMLQTSICVSALVWRTPRGHVRLCLSGGVSKCNIGAIVSFLLILSCCIHQNQFAEILSAFGACQPWFEFDKHRWQWNLHLVRHVLVGVIVEDCPSLHSMIQSWYARDSLGSLAPRNHEFGLIRRSRLTRPQQVHPCLAPGIRCVPARVRNDHFQCLQLSIVVNFRLITCEKFCLMQYGHTVGITTNTPSKAGE